MNRLNARNRLSKNTASLINSSNVIFDYNGKRVFEMINRQGTKKPIRILYDKEKVLHYDGNRSLTIRDLKDSSAEYMFDPRVLGLTTTYGWSDSLDGQLPLDEDQIKKIDWVGPGEVNGISVEIVEITDSYDQLRKIALDPKDNFKVYKYDLIFPSLKYNSSVSYYNNEHYDDIPSKVITKYFDKSGNQTGERVVNFDLTKRLDHVPPETWKISSFNLPVGATVSDLRISERIGYWDGKNIVQSMTAAVSKANVSNGR